MSDRFEKVVQHMQDVCKCALCLEIYQDPKSLPCRHSFCSECLHNLVTFNVSGKSSIKCPTCQKEHDFAKNETVSDMNTELILIQLLDVMQSSPEDNCEKPSNEPLLSCSVDGCQTSPSLVCSECYLQYCAKCDSKKCFSKILMEESKTEGIRKFFCDIHKCFTSKFCVDCHEHLCIYCTNLEHKNHKLISMDQLEKQCREDLQVYSKTLEHFVKSMQDKHNKIVDLSDNNIPKLEKEINSLAENLKKSLEEIIDNMKEVYIQKLRDSVNELRDEFKETLESFEDLQRDILSLPTNSTITELVCKAGYVGAQLMSKKTRLLHKDFSVKVDLVGCNSKIDNIVDLESYFGRLNILFNSDISTMIYPESVDYMHPIQMTKPKVDFAVEESSETVYLRIARTPYNLTEKKMNISYKYSGDYNGLGSEDGVKYTLDAMKNKKWLSMYVGVELESHGNICDSCEVDIEFIVRNIHHGEDRIRTTSHISTHEQRTHGFSKFMPLKELTRQNGFLVNGEVVMEAFVTMKIPLKVSKRQYLMDSDSYDYDPILDASES